MDKSVVFSSMVHEFAREPASAPVMPNDFREHSDTPIDPLASSIGRIAGSDNVAGLEGKRTSNPPFFMAVIGGCAVSAVIWLGLIAGVYLYLQH